MTCRSTLLSAGLLAMAGACSSPGSTSPVDSEGLDATAEEAAASNAGTDSGEPSSDASTSLESGSAPDAHDAGTSGGRDAGTVRVACNQPALGGVPDGVAFRER